MNHNISLKSIPEFEQQNICFHIPGYQRGYRWKTKQVRQLINDIKSFTPTESCPYYFLQALAVANDKEHNKVNVVDGQQRLTTIGLILGKQDTDIKLSYSREADKALDRYFKKNAMDVIADELKSDKARIEFCNKLKTCCRFLYYEVDSDKELSTFDELNSGKIPAKDSELVKCVMLTIGNDESSIITQSRANEWDEIERKLYDDDFFAFMTPRGTWRENDRMTIILRYAGLIPTEEEKNEEVFPFLSVVQNELKTKSRETLWKSVCSAYYRLVEWYKDPLMYHAFGAYVHRKIDHSINSITKGCKIAEKINDMASYQPDKNLDDYRKGKNDRLYDYLLLSNVAFCWKRWPNRYSFKIHREIEWSLEHIFARNQKDLNEAELEEWFGEDITKDKIKEYLKACDNGIGDEWLAGKLGEKYPTTEDNSIKNLAMLPKKANSSLNNKLFEGKRNEIRKWANDSWNIYWAPPMTEAVFMKSLVGLKMGEPFWSDDDKTAYQKAMESDIRDFVNKLKEAATL